MATRFIAGEAEVSAEQVRAEMEAVFASRTFERSERLRRFLSYVCDLTLRGESARINEYLIGTEVFDRGADYSPNEDSIVRRQAHTLRHKLQEYYESEGKHSSLRIELPVGKYVPVFRRHPDSAPKQPLVAAAARPGWPIAALAGAMLVFGAAVFLAGWFAGRHSGPVSAQASSREQTPALAEIWGPWLEDPSGAVICFSNPMTTVVKHYEKAVPFQSAPYRFRPAGPEEGRLREAFHLPPGGYIYQVPTMAQGKMGEAMSAVSLASFLARAGLPVRSTQSRFLSWEDLRRRNFVLLGHDEANQWLDPLLEKLPLRLAATDGERPRRIRNMQPAPGESAEYQVEFPADGKGSAQEYALVSMIPGVDGRRHLLLISGLNAQATEMAAEYLTSAAGLDELTSRLRATAPDHKGPWYFQAVLRAEVRDKVPTRGSLLTVRVL